MDIFTTSSQLSIVYYSCDCCHFTSAVSLIYNQQCVCDEFRVHSLHSTSVHLYLSLICIFLCIHIRYAKHKLPRAINKEWPSKTDRFKSIKWHSR